MEANSEDQLLVITAQDNTILKPQSELVSIHTYIQAATSQNTRRAYQADVRHFISWGGRLPSSPDVLLRYLQEHAPSLNPRTLKRRLVAIKHWHTCQGFADSTAHPLVRKTLSGILHVHGKPPEKAPPFSTEQLILLTRHLKSRGKLADWRNNALLQVGFAVKYNDIIANAVMSHNVLDMSNVILQLHEDGYPIAKNKLARTSPLLTDHLNRFGEYVVNMQVEPVDINRAMKLPI